MSGTIPRHPKLGLNPRLTTHTCPLCLTEEDGEGIIMLGIKNYKEICPSCKAVIYGGFNKTDVKHGGYWCPGCNGTVRGERVELEDREKIRLGNRPCKTCKEWMTKGIVLVAAKKEAGGTRLLGRYTVIKEEAWKRIPLSPGIVESGLKHRACYIDDDAWQKLGLPMTNKEEQRIT